MTKVHVTVVILIVLCVSRFGVAAEAEKKKENDLGDLLKAAATKGSPEAQIAAAFTQLATQTSTTTMTDIKTRTALFDELTVAHRTKTKFVTDVAQYLTFLLKEDMSGGEDAAGFLQLLQETISSYRFENSEQVVHDLHFNYKADSGSMNVMRVVIGQPSAETGRTPVSTSRVSTSFSPAADYVIMTHSKSSLGGLRSKTKTGIRWMPKTVSPRHWEGVYALLNQALHFSGGASVDALSYDPLKQVGM